jgi:hypothetical protein
VTCLQQSLAQGMNASAAASRRRRWQTMHKRWKWPIALGMVDFFAVSGRVMTEGQTLDHPGNLKAGID